MIESKKRTFVNNEVLLAPLAAVDTLGGFARNAGSANVLEGGNPLER